VTLRWVKPDDYHIASDCGRFTVTRLTVTPHVWYVAFKRRFEASAVEIGATQLPATATDAERTAAIHEMQELCNSEAAA